MFFLASCSTSSYRPNYNRDSDHNSSVLNRNKEVMKQDKHNKKSMSRLRKQCSKSKQHKRTRKSNRKLVR